MVGGGRQAGLRPPPRPSRHLPRTPAHGAEHPTRRGVGSPLLRHGRRPGGRSEAARPLLPTVGGHRRVRRPTSGAASGPSPHPRGLLRHPSGQGPRPDRRIADGGVEGAGSRLRVRPGRSDHGGRAGTYPGTGTGDRPRPGAGPTRGAGVAPDPGPPRCGRHDCRSVHRWRIGAGHRSGRHPRGGRCRPAHIGRGRRRPGCRRQGSGPVATRPGGTTVGRGRCGPGGGKEAGSSCGGPSGIHRRSGTAAVRPGTGGRADRDVSRTRVNDVVRPGPDRELGR